MAISGEVQLKIRIQGQETEASFLAVQRLQEPAILGYPWLVENQAVCDFQRQCLHFGTRKRRTVYWASLLHTSPPGQPVDLTELRHSIPEAHVKDFLALLQKQKEAFYHTKRDH